MKQSLDQLSSLGRYTVASERAADQIIRAYSTSFGTATKLLGPSHRTHVRNIYALARIADELVDGASAEAGEGLAGQHRALDLLEQDVEHAVSTGFSSNPIVHAFATTARLSRFGNELTRPFFSSMRTDITVGEPHALQVFTNGQHASYVYGSAEVIGLMCLRVFVRDEHYTEEQQHQLEQGARSLGAAFQNVNFLRDLADDTDRLGRSYLAEEGRVSEADHRRWITEIRQQLVDATATLPLLPSDARLAVACALRMFERLTDRLERVPTEQLYKRRVGVPRHEKAWLILREMITAGKERTA